MSYFLVGGCRNKENLAPIVQNFMEVPRSQWDLRPKQRAVLGSLSENDQHSRSFGQGTLHSKNGSLWDNAFPSSQKMAFPTCPSTSNFEIYVEEPDAIVQSVPSTRLSEEPPLQYEESSMLEHREFCLFLDLSSGSCQDASMQSQPEDEEPLPPPDSLEYVKDIYCHLRESEVKCRPKPGYMKKQPDITNSMRVILVDWLVEVGEEYKLCLETLYLTVNYLDRFLSCMSVLREKLQLVGTAAALLASKYEEIYPPETDEFIYITDEAYTKKQLLRMEHLFLRVLGFDMTVPTTYQFLRQFLTIEAVCSRTENLALYVSELSLLDVDPFLKHLPSKVAAAAYCLANYTLNGRLWPESLCAFTGYSVHEIAPCLQDLHKVYLGAADRPQQAMRVKYKSSKYCGVSLISPPDSLPVH
ncbi:cyclin-A1 isoform X2 [Lepisosteus oculatus]|uniref:cyclin-A1 isoform X2 n=1 Tax=Lepisosteus oculatus TaxID=7918 RepID=UPI00073FEA5B|nr:PREDICTED: cyclin-A1 isoform X2 [Lepisosteus oculatus]